MEHLNLQLCNVCPTVDGENLAVNTTLAQVSFDQACYDSGSLTEHCDNSKILFLNSLILMMS